jgi:Uma2 family endonuclease
VAPDLVVEVLSPDDRWPAVQAKVAEYLEAGVLEVLVLDPEGRRAFLFSAERAPAVVTEGEEVELLGEFRKVVGSFFE